MKLLKISIIAGLCQVSLGVWASPEAIYKPEVIVVTATRTPQSLSDTLASTSVISAEEIQRLQAFDLIDVLRTTVGLDFQQKGGAGSTSSIFIRGTNSQHALVLINGQRVSSATLGTTAIENISMDQIERIEIVRGPKSSLYGADAIGGVINIITQNGADAPTVKIESGFGSRGVVDHAVSYSARYDRLSVATGLNYLESNAYDKTTLIELGSDDRDNHRNFGGYLNLGMEFSPEHQLQLNYSHNEGETSYDNTFGCMNAISFTPVDCQPVGEFRNRALSITSENEFSEQLNTLVQLGYSADLSATKDNLANVNTLFGGPGIFESERYSFLAQANIKLNDAATLSIGEEYYVDKIDGEIYLINDTFTALEANDYLDEKGKKIDSRHNQAVFVQLQMVYRAFDVLLGIRNDDNEAYGKENTGNFSIGFGNVEESGKLIGSIGTSFRAPTFNDLYWPDPFGPGNPNLEPETSVTKELAYKLEHRQVNYGITIYKTDIEDLIQWAPIDPNDPFSFWTPANVQKVEIEGIEMEISRQLDNWIWSVNTSYADAEDSKTGNQLIDRAKRKGSFNIDYNAGMFTYGVSWLAQDGRYSDTANTVKTSGYNRWDLRLSAKLRKDLLVQARITNLFNTEYEHRAPYIQEGRGLMVKFIFQPQF